MGQTPQQFGAKRNQKWPALAIRRFMLYDVFLHELGHLQPVPNRRSARLSFPRERLAQEFAIEWCDRLWSTPFDHPDPVHNRPSVEELLRLNEQETLKSDLHPPEPLTMLHRLNATCS
jgi:hypothetical protein